MTVKKVFTTWGRVRANFGGVAAADQYCMDSAADGGLGGNWVAFVKDTGSGEPSDRIMDVGAWYLHRTGIKVFNSKADITSATTPQSIIGLDEDGNALRASVQEPDVLSWIGDGNGSCLNWSSSSPGDSARCGNVRDTTNWRNFGTCQCNEQYHLYCFEQ